jgi:hypothetical protein
MLPANDWAGVARGRLVQAAPVAVRGELGSCSGTSPPTARRRAVVVTGKGLTREDSDAFFASPDLGLAIGSSHGGGY